MYDKPMLAEVDHAQAHYMPFPAVVQLSDAVSRLLQPSALFEHNWLRSHPALREPAADLPKGQRYRRRSPAMAIGLTDHVWTWEEFLRHPICQHHKE